MAAMSILVGQEQGKVPVTVLKVEGDIDASSYKALQDKAAEVIDAGAAGFGSYSAIAASAAGDAWMAGWRGTIRHFESSTYSLDLTLR